VEGRSIGGGFSLGDNHYELPYFYINPYGVDRPGSLPGLAHGDWSDHWFGAVLTSQQLSNQETAAQTAEEFVASAMEYCHDLLHH
jgi:hypothetical protein